MPPQAFVKSPESSSRMGVGDGEWSEAIASSVPSCRSELKCSMQGQNKQQGERILKVQQMSKQTFEMCQVPGDVLEIKHAWQLQNLQKST